MATQLRCCVLLASMAVAGAAASSSSCVATAKYPDGREIERCARAPHSEHCAGHSRLRRDFFLSRSECIVEGEKGSKKAEKPKKGISEEMAWLKDTRWVWNDWREVRNPALGGRRTPAENAPGHLRSGHLSCERCLPCAR
jgi:hypothetical protein